MSDTASEAIVPSAPARAASEQAVLTAAKGGSVTFAGSLFTYAARFVMGILLARFLGAENYGLYNLALTVATLAAGLALLGMSSALVRYISLYNSRRDTEGLWGILQVGIGLPTALSLVMAGATYVLADSIAHTVFQEARLAPVLRLASLLIPFFTTIEALVAATRGFKKMHYAAIAQNITQPMIQLILVAALAIIGLNATRAVAAQLPATLVVTLMLVYFLNKLFSLKRPIRAARRETGQILKFGMPLYLTYLIQTFRKDIQVFLLGALNTVTAVGVFTLAAQVNQIGSMFHDAVVTVSMPIIAELFDRGEREPLAKFYQTATKWTFSLNLPLFLVVILFRGPILSIFGESFAGGSAALAILAWGNLVNTGTGVCGVILNMTEKTTLTLLNSVLLFILVTGLNVLLIPQWGLIGAAVASLTAVVVINLLRLLEVFILFRLLPYNSSFIKPIVAGLTALVTVWSIGQLFDTEANLVYTAISAAILLIIYSGMILLLGLSDEDRLVLARISRRLGIRLWR